MSWFKSIFKGESGGASNPQEIVRFYQQLGFFVGANPASIIERQADEYGESPRAKAPWEDVFLLAYAEGEVWTGDPEADVCAENKVYCEVLAEWARISHGTFTPSEITEHWDSQNGPITLTFELSGREASVSPRYQDDWIDLNVLQQINLLIAKSGRQFECAVDGNFALVLCLTAEQKKAMQKERQFPFAW